MSIEVPSSRVPARGRHRHPAGRLAAAGLFILVGAGPALSQPASGARAPENLAARPSLRAVVRQMAERSPTFRRQCARIAGTPGLVVRMHDAGRRGDRPYQARTVIRKHEYGAVTAEVMLYPPFDPSEIIAHEFEHLIEQIEGLNLHLLSLVAGSGVRRTVDGSFETDRAIAAGRRVALECGAVGAGPAAAPDY